MQRYNDKKNERKGRSNMKTFRLRCKKTLCSGINDRDSIWILICNTKDCTSSQYKVLDQSQQTGQCSNRIPVKEWNIQTDQAFLVSCGGANTPAGTFYTPAKYRWQTLMGPSYGQYCTRVHGGVLFHSVWYYEKNPSTQSTVQFNKLGQTASHGCIRLSVGDAKWIV